MSTLITYKGMQVVDPAPSAAGGLALNTNFRALGDHLLETDAHDASSSLVASRIVLRDAAGGFDSGAVRLISNAAATTDSQAELIPVPATGSQTCKPSKLRFRATFDNMSDQNPRVVAQLKAGFAYTNNDNNGAWGHEYLAFGLGSNESAVDPVERARLTPRGFEVTSGGLIVGFPTDVSGFTGPVHACGPGGVWGTTTQTIVVLERPAVAGQSFRTGARFDLGKTSANVDAYTRLDLVIAGGPGGTSWQSPIQTWTWEGHSGINNTAPTEALDVTGNVKASGTLSAGSFVRLADVDTATVAGTAAGQIVWDGTAGHFMGWTGSAWVQLD